MLQAVGKVYSQIVVDYAPLHGNDYVERERTALGLTHADVSAMVLEKWMLPPTIVQAVRCHHGDNLANLADEDARVLAGILNAAGQLGRILCEKPEKASITQACAAAMQVLRMDAASLQQALKDIEPVIRDFADLLRIYIVRSNVFHRINDIIAQELTGTVQPATA